MRRLVAAGVAVMVIAKPTIIVLRRKKGRERYRAFRHPLMTIVCKVDDLVAEYKIGAQDDGSKKCSSGCTSHHVFSEHRLI